MRTYGLTPDPEYWAKDLDITAYMRRQGEACVYMLDLLDKLTALKPCREWELLRLCHERQADEISDRVVFKKDIRRSFYFDSLYKELGLTTPDPGSVLCMAAHAAGYLRGHLRYTQLIDAGRPFGKVWEHFFQDSERNMTLMLAVGMGLHAPQLLHSTQTLPKVWDFAEAWVQVVKAETRVMEKIWYHNMMQASNA